MLILNDPNGPMYFVIMCVGEGEKERKKERKKERERVIFLYLCLMIMCVVERERERQSSLFFSLFYTHSVIFLTQESTTPHSVCMCISLFISLFLIVFFFWVFLIFHSFYSSLLIIFVLLITNGLFFISYFISLYFSHLTI